jgi:hypothetical protein
VARNLVITKVKLSILQILYWKIAPSIPSGPPNSDPVNEGPVLSVRYSLDHKVIGIQRSRHEIEFRNRETGVTCSKKCRADSETILGFFWTDCPTCDVILVKTRYVEHVKKLQLQEQMVYNESPLRKHATISCLFVRPISFVIICVLIFCQLQRSNVKFFRILVLY